ncbi:MAG: PTS sugar transporter subunit IIA [Planctomycetaceae bacterium]|nr:PTS sugar transporter subunit IIA [Planctomycetaceae bacterium]
MVPETYSLDELATNLGRDRRELEKLVSRGRIPGRKVSGSWSFHASDIAEWLESEMRTYSDSQLAAVERSQKSVELDASRPVTSLMPPEHVAVPLEARTKRSVLEQLVEVAGRTWKIWEPAAVLKAVQDREELCTTAFDNGVAIPHARQPLPDVMDDSVVAFGRTYSGIPCGAPNNSLTDLFFLVACRDTRTHLQVLARLGRMIQRSGFVEALRAAETDEAAYQVIVEAEQAVG